MAHPRPYEDWLKIDLEWIPQCDCLLRIGGKSSGADKEATFAIEKGIPVFYSINEIEIYYAQKINQI